MGQNIGTGGRAWGKILGPCEEYTGVALTYQKIADCDRVPLRLCWDLSNLSILTITMNYRVILDFGGGDGDLRKNLPLSVLYTPSFP